MTINEKAAYLKGLAQGLGVCDSTKEGKVLTELLELVADMADEINALAAENKELRDYIEEIDEDLGQVEEDFYVTDSEEDEEDEDDFDEDDAYYEIECPSCGEKVYFDESLEVDELVCPACGEKVSDVEVFDDEESEEK